MPKTKSFKKLQRSVKSHYLGKKVPAKYRARYGKRYGKKDVTGLSYAIARSKEIKTDLYSRRRNK